MHKTACTISVIKSKWCQPGRVVKSSGFEILRSQVQILFWPLADVVLGSPEFNLAVYLPPAKILNLVMFMWIFSYNCLFHWSWKAPMGSGQLRIHTYKQSRHVTLILLFHEQQWSIICHFKLGWNCFASGIDEDPSAPSWSICLSPPGRNFGNLSLEILVE